MLIKKEYIKRIEVLHLIFFKEVSENYFSYELSLFSSWINEMSSLMLLLFFIINVAKIATQIITAAATIDSNLKFKELFHELKT